PTPLGCTNNGPNVGINGTPTVDVNRHTIYVISYTLVDSKPSYRLHALDLATLTDKSGSPVTVSASHQLADGSTVSFNPAVQRQRAALLESLDQVYAAFASFCDFKPEESRGWLLGWNAGSLNPLSANGVTDTLSPPTPPSPYFLSSIWMSGYGLAAENDGDVF